MNGDCCMRQAVIDQMRDRLKTLTEENESLKLQIEQSNRDVLLQVRHAIMLIFENSCSAAICVLRELMDRHKGPSEICLEMDAQFLTRLSRMMNEDVTDNLYILKAKMRNIFHKLDIASQTKDYKTGTALMAELRELVYGTTNTNSDFETMYFGKWVAKCAVHDGKGNHCPGNPVHNVEYRGRRIGLCKDCFINFQKGEFDKKDRPYIKIN